MTPTGLQAYVPLVIYLLVAAFLAGVLITLSTLVGWKRPNKAKQQPYECGITPTGELLIGEAELQIRLAAWKQLPPQHKPATRGYARLFEDSVLQADQGCDFDFLLRQGEDG